MSNTINNPTMAIDKPNQFPWKLYDMLQTAEKRNEEHIISWIRDGKAFKVHNRNLFIEEYMKKMFNQTKFKSFQRQLNLWGFERVQNGPDKGSYFHPLFVKGRRDCCQRLTRVRLKGTGEKTAHQGVIESPEQNFSPSSIASAAKTSVSAAGATKFPSGTSSDPRIGNVTTVAPSLLLGALVDVPGTTTNTAAMEASAQGPSRHQQFADLIHYHTSQRRREMIRNAAIGLRPDLSLAVVGAPLFATASEKSDNSGNDGQQRDRVLQQHRHHQQHHQQQHQQHHQRQHQRQQQQQHQQQHQNQQREEEKHQIEQQQFHQQQQIQLPVHLQGNQSQHPPQLLHQQHEQQSQSQSHSQSQLPSSQNQSQYRSEETRRRHSGLEALLSVSAQRRREEELALLLGLSDPGGQQRR